MLFQINTGGEYKTMDDQELKLLRTAVTVDKWEEKIDNRIFLEEAMMRLNEMDQELIHLKFYDGLSSEAIAETLHITVEYVNDRLNTLIMDLRYAYRHGSKVLDGYYDE